MTMQPLKSTYDIQAFDVGPMQNLIYLIIDIETKYTAIVDPAWDLENVNRYIEENDLILKVNGQPVITDASHNQVVAMIQGKKKIAYFHDVQDHTR